MFRLEKLEVQPPFSFSFEIYVLFGGHSEGLEPGRQDSQIILRDCSEEARRGARIYKSFCNKVTKRLLLIKENLPHKRASLIAQSVKNLPAMQETPRFNSWVGKIPWRRKWQSTPVFLPRETQGQRSLVGYSPWITRVGHTLETKPPPPKETGLSQLRNLVLFYVWEDARIWAS